MAKKDEQQQADEQPRNTQKLTEGFIQELVRIEDEIERETEKHIKPLTENRKDILAAAKDNQLNVAALKRAVKFKRASEKQRDAIAKEEADTELYLSFVQLTLFPGGD